VRSVIRCLQWRFNAWADDFVKLYFSSIDCPYAEVSADMCLFDVLLTFRCGV